MKIGDYIEHCAVKDKIFKVVEIGSNWLKVIDEETKKVYKVLKHNVKKVIKTQ